MKCNSNIEKDVNSFLSDTTVDSLYLFGGAVLDPLVNENAKINDYDVCVRTEKDFHKAIINLKAKEYDVSEVVRTHNLYVVVHDKNGMQYDFSCMNPEDNGIYGIEKIYAKFPENKVVDAFNSINLLKKGQLTLASNPKKEGAYNLLRRFIANAGKYNLPLEKNGVNQKVIDEVKKEFVEQKASVPQDRVRCLDRLFKVMAKVKDKKTFVQNFAEQELLKDAFPEFHKLFSNKKFVESDVLAKSNKADELLDGMVNFFAKESGDRDDMINASIILMNREKARMNPDIYDKVIGYMGEKTSKARLEKTLNPVFNYIMSKGR